MTGEVQGGVPGSGTVCAKANRSVVGGGACGIGNAKVEVSWTRFQRALNVTLLGGIWMLQEDSEQEREGGGHWL